MNTTELKNEIAEKWVNYYMRADSEMITRGSLTFLILSSLIELEQRLKERSDEKCATTSEVKSMNPALASPAPEETNGAEYSRGVTAGKLEALSYTEEERECYGKWAMGCEIFKQLQSQLAESKKEVERLEQELDELLQRQKGDSLG